CQNQLFQFSEVESNRGQQHESKNRLSALFLSEEKVDASPCHDRDGSGVGSMHIDKGLKDENLIDCWFLQNGSLTFLDYPVEFQAHCITDAHNSATISTGYSDAGEESQESVGTAFRDGVDRASKMPLTAGNITGKRKTVRFECDFDQSSSSKKHEMAGKINFSAALYNPTSLNQSDEIQTQTPGTISPANMESAVRGRPRISSQFVHSASNITENASICNLPEDSDESVDQCKVQACREKTENETPTSATCEGKSEESTDENSKILGLRVKQSEEKSNKNMAALSTVTSGDRPIIGMVAAHWNEKEQTHISPKWWDGNGIPNSTNKYKEDQKVSWHATPFEERLEKALSEESGQGFIPSRKTGIKEEAERDKAISQMHHSAQSTSIVSF
ncbi:unnamed protein product, partial [Thlaspi arvense]